MPKSIPGGAVDSSGRPDRRFLFPRNSVLDSVAMSRLEVDISHRLSRDEARLRIDRMTEKLARDFSAECNWDHDGRLVVKRKGLEAFLDIADDKVHVGMELGLFMRPFAGTIRAGIAKQLADILA